MAHILFSCLGGAGPSGDRQYSTYRYRFPSGEVYEGSYFAQQLMDYLATQGKHFDQLVIIGTDASLWSLAVKALAGPGEETSELRDRLNRASSQRSVDASLASEVSRLLSGALGIRVEALLIPYLHNSEDALGMVKTIHARVNREDRITFDVTNGLRHLPIVGLFAALAVEALRDAKVDGIWYGAAELRDSEGAVPAIRLDGILDIARWIRALAVFDASGDFDGLTTLVRQAGAKVPTAAPRGSSRTLEGMMRIDEARRAGLDMLSRLRKSDSAIAELFRPKLEERLEWTRREDLCGAQISLACQHIDNGNLLSGALLGYEAVLTWLIEAPESPLKIGGDPREENNRHAARTGANRKLRNRNTRLGIAYTNIADLRNCLAHAGPPQTAETRHALRSPGETAWFLKKHLAAFFPAEFGYSDRHGSNNR